MAERKSLTDKQITARYNKCVNEQLCFISLKPLPKEEETVIQPIGNLMPPVNRKYLKPYYDSIKK